MHKVISINLQGFKNHLSCFKKSPSIYDYGTTPTPLHLKWWFPVFVWSFVCQLKVTRVKLPFLPESWKWKPSQIVKVHSWSRWNLYKTRVTLPKTKILLLKIDLPKRSVVFPTINLQVRSVCFRMRKPPMIFQNFRETQQLLSPSDTWQCETRTQPWTLESRHEFQPRRRLSLRKWGPCLGQKSWKSTWDGCMYFTCI